MGRRRSRKRRSASVQLARSATGSRVDSLMTMLLGARLFASMRERRDERHDEEEDHPEDHQQVRDRDQDERPVQVRGRRIHAGHLLTSAFDPRLGLARTCWPLRAPLSVCDSAPPPQPTTRRSLSPVPLLSYLCRDGPTGAVAEEEERECATLVPSQAIVLLRADGWTCRPRRTCHGQERCDSSTSFAGCCPWCSRWSRGPSNGPST